MKTVHYMAAQGDLLIIKTDNIPAGLKPAKEENGKHILAHSETGHHHVIDSRSAQLLIDETNEFLSYLSVSEDADVVHERDFDTHETLRVPRGDYEIRRQREHTPEGFRRATD